MKRMEIPVGTRFSRLVTTSPPYVDQQSTRLETFVDVQCDCGTVLAISTANLLRIERVGKCQSCGCLNRENISALARSQAGSNHPSYRGEDSGASKRAWLYTEKSHPCMDCGQKYPPIIMQFDHRDPDLKLFEVKAKVIRRKLSLAEIKVEREKCDLVCPNCHAWRTWLRKTGRSLVPLSQWDDSHPLTEVA